MFWYSVMLLLSYNLTFCVWLWSVYDFIVSAPFCHTIIVYAALRSDISSYPFLFSQLSFLYNFITIFVINSRFGRIYYYFCVLTFFNIFLSSTIYLAVLEIHRRAISSFSLCFLRRSSLFVLSVSIFMTLCSFRFLCVSVFSDVMFCLFSHVSLFLFYDIMFCLFSLCLFLWHYVLFVLSVSVFLFLWSYVLFVLSVFLFLWRRRENGAKNRDLNWQSKQPPTEDSKAGSPFLFFLKPFLWQIIRILSPFALYYHITPQVSI